MKRIGLIGEDPNDTSSIINLLKSKYSKGFSFIPLVKHIRGHRLDNADFPRKLQAGIESSKNKIHYFIYIRDLDALESQKGNLKIRKDWFNRLNDEFGNGVFLLNIYELEALILADIQTFNLQYKSKINFKGNPMMQEKPKEFLMAKTDNCQKKYVVSHAPSVFEKLDFETIHKNCLYFKTFIEEFEQLVA